MHELRKELYELLQFPHEWGRFLVQAYYIWKKENSRPLQRLVAVIFALCIVSTAFAQQSKQYAFTHYSTQTGLFSNQINSILQDETGFLWIGTNDGLIRYDGARYKVFRHSRKDSTSLPYNQVFGLLIDRNQNFWVLFTNGKVAIFNRKNFSFTQVPVRPREELSLKAGVKRLVADEYGNVFIILGASELLTWNKKSNEFSAAHNFYAFNPDWKFNDIIHQPGTKKYWIGIAGLGLAVYNDSTKQLSYPGNNIEKEPAIERLKDVKNVSNFMFDRKGRLWFTNWDTRFSYIYCFDFKNQQPYIEKHGFVSTFNTYYEINGFHEQADGTIWFKGYKAFGYFTDKNKQFTLIPSSDDAIESSIDYRNISALFEDTERNVWIGTGNNGIFRVNPSLQLFDNILHTNRETGKQGDGSPTSFALDKDGSLIVGFFGDGIYRYDKNFNEIPLKIKGIPEKNFIAVPEMISSKDSNTIWMATDVGVYAYNKSERAVIKYNPAILENRPVRQLAEDRSGNLWLGISRFGVFKWNAAKGRIKFEEGIIRIRDIPNEQIYSIKIDSRGLVWIACASTGLYVVDPATDKIVLHFHEKAKAALKLPEESVFSILEYNDTVMAIATSNHILLYDRYLHTSKYLTSDNTITGQISSIEKDKKGNLWISTTSALYTVDPKTRVFIAYNRSDGIINDYFVPSSSYVLPDGRMIFGSGGKFVVFDPNMDDVELPAHKIVITDFKVMDRPLSVDSLMQLKQINLDHEQHSITIDFTTLTYNNYFSTSYQLEGLDEERKIANRNNQVTYTYLRPGNYKLRFSTVDTKGVLREVLALNISIAPAFYNTWWFYSMIILIIAVILFWLDKQRIKRIRNEQQMRMALATNLNKDVNTTLKNINVLSEIASMKSEKYPDEAQDYLKEIQHKSRNMVVAMEDMLSGIHPKNEELNKNNLSGQKLSRKFDLKFKKPEIKNAGKNHNKELQIFLWIIVPYDIGMNIIVFGECIFYDLKNFAIGFGLSTAYFSLVYALYALVAVLMQKRFPANSDLFRRVGISLPIYYVMNILLVTGLYAFFSFLQPFDCVPMNNHLLWAIGFACFSSTVITFLNEAMVNWDKWKTSVTETEQLKNSYQKTKLFGLKGQINPHFLFNCFNSLSSLIDENEEKAEQFLDEMTKVHRYMLRGDDDQLVTVEEELKFVQSYVFLTEVRFGEAIAARIDVSHAIRQKYIPPLSLQVILENIIYANTASKSSPLKLAIIDDGDNIIIRHSINTKTSKDDSNFEEGLDNLITKYRLLHVPDITVSETGVERIIVLPLLEKREVIDETI